ncbi:MAG TPA: PEP-CTERM-box response regulator transcription factor [Verrucomicrobiae bacterium]|jgi:two-component system NtrC family response regulator|nr:PEP-CTERM-box response regulator transcription factor [Verrucomicrobiae bacterium]
MNSRLLIVEDDEEIRTQMKWALGKDYELQLVENRASAVEAFRSSRPAVVLLDLGLPPRAGSPEEGLAALSEILALDRLAKVIIVTGQSEKEIALQAVGVGAYDFLCKPIEMDELKLVLKRCFHVAGLEREYRAMRELLQGDSFEGMLGNSRPMQAVFDAIRKVATTDVPVLILGESGTGKEMVARAVHQRSNRKNGPFVPINCSAIPETLLESELFGHEKGAFTGAHIQRKGRIESAAGGTLFLDEIGEIPTQLQVKLLRFLQEQRIARIGGRDEFHVDTRVVTATNADLKKNMGAGTFREDLFYRLSVVQICMPPLRERENDITLLAQAFLNRFASQIPKKGLAFDRDAIRSINAHQWPGNVRELENSVRRAVIMAEGKHLTAKDMGLTSAVTGNVATLKSAREALEREFIQRALRKHAGKITAAATDLGVSRPTLYELMDKLEIARD